MRKVIFCFMIVIVFFYGCSSKLLIRENEPDHMFRKSYHLGHMQETTRGSEMISICSAWQLPSYHIKTAYSPAKLPAIKPEQEWIARHILGNNYILTTKKYPYHIIFGIEITPDGELVSDKPWIELQGYKRPVQDAWDVPDRKVFDPGEAYVLHDGYYRAVLIYSGMTGRTMNISYREFHNYKDKPAVCEQLRYDLNKSDEIVFRSLRIKIVKADQTKVRFKVMDDGGLNWVPEVALKR